MTARSAIVLAIGVFMIACSPDILFIGDPVLAAIDATDEGLAREITAAGRNMGERVQIDWDPSIDLSTAWLETRIAESDASIVVLSPYFSLFASDLAGRFMEKRFVSFFGPDPTQPNLTVVRFVRLTAFAELGRILADWVAAGESRVPAGLFLVDDARRRTEMETLLSRYDEAGDTALQYREFRSPPDREQVRGAIREFRAAGANALVLFLGNSGRYALELLRSDPMAVVTEHLAPDQAMEEMILATVYNPLGDALASVLALPEGERWGVVVAVDSVAKEGRALLPLSVDSSSTGSDE